jgi:cytochrome b subunit of formate dehydrogenase
MPNNKAPKLWFVNVLSFILFSILTFTGLTNWLLLPRGYAASGGFLISLRHFLRQVHEFAAVLFILVVLVHLVLHWTYVKSNLKKHGIIK